MNLNRDGVSLVVTTGTKIMAHLCDSCDEDRGTMPNGQPRRVCQACGHVHGPLPNELLPESPIGAIAYGIAQGVDLQARDTFQAAGM